MNKKKTIMIGIVVLTVVMITGVTYALWQINLNQESENIVSTSCFKVSLKEENPITLSQVYPITDEEGLSLIPFTFTVENICDTNASYQVNLEILKGTTLENLEELEDLDYLKMSFESIGETRQPVFLTTKEEVSPTLKDNQGELISKKAYKLETGYLGVGEKRSYEISLWLDENTPAEDKYMDKIFQSKISVIATYIKDYDKISPITNIEVTNLSNQIHVDASASHDNTSIKYYYYSLDGESFIKTKEPEYTFEVGELNYGVATDTIKTLADSLSDKYTVYVKTEDEYGNISDIVSSKKLYKDFAYDNTADNNLRYIGANPNNYVSFNDELWRIIGVMENIDDGTGKKETRIKLIRNESIGNYSWDNKPAGTGSSTSEYGSNDWRDSKLQNVLNSGPYWNRTNGQCPKGKNNASIACDFSNIGMLEETKTMITNAIWNIGGARAFQLDTNGLSKHWYTYERSSDVYSNHSTVWIGLVGLMYASDYGFATRGGNNVSRSTCLNYALWDWGSQKAEECRNNSWIYKVGQNQWTMSPFALTASDIALIGGPGNLAGINTFGVYASLAISPVVYLKSDVKIDNGIGTQEKPFNLSL